MTAVRRILLALVTLMLIADVAALALVKGQGSPEPSDPGAGEKFNVVAKVDNAKQAGIVTKAIENLGVTVESEKSSRQVEKQTGFRLVFEASSVEILKAVAETLSYKGYTCSISEKDDKAQLYLGGNFKTKAQAAQVMSKVQRQESIKFEIVNGVELKKVPTNKLTVRNLDQETAKKVTDILAELKVTDYDTEAAAE